MQQNQRPSFEKLMRLMGQMYRQTISTDMMNLYWQILKKYSWPAIQWAFKYHVQSPEYGCWMAKPADIIRYLEGDNQSKTLKAWSQVQTKLRSTGRYGSIDFTDKYIYAVIADMGGWSRLCQSLESQMGAVKKEFEQRYQRYLMFPPQELTTYEQ